MSSGQPKPSLLRGSWVVIAGDATVATINHDLIQGTHNPHELPTFQVLISMLGQSPLDCCRVESRSE